MDKRNQLIFCIIAIGISGCAGLSAPPAPVVDARAPAEMPAPAVTARTPVPSTQPDRSLDLLFQAIAAAGVDYKNGGRNHQTGFDCSGLVAFVFREAYGMDLPHNSRAQSSFGQTVQARDLQPGDLVFFNTQRQPFSHVGIYLGEGKFIHAPRTGAAVRTENLRARYWAARFDGARRISPEIVHAEYTRPGRNADVTHP